MFAAALWTESKKSLVLVRDRLGIKPLYLHRRGEDLFFGSELKAILAHPEVERRLDPAGLEYYLCLNYVPCPRTLIEGIEKLPPGYWLEWQGGRIESEPYWKLERDVGIGLWTSGGLDSSTILHYAALSSSARLKTFSISFQGRSFDESRYSREIAARYGAEHHELDLNPDSGLRDVVAELPYYQDEPIADAGALPVWFLARLSRQHVTVALSGEGADELFGGYLSYRADSLARRFSMLPGGLRKAALALAGHWPVSDDKISFEYRVKRFIEGSLLDPDVAHCYWNGGFSPAQRERLLFEAGRDGVGKLFGVMPSKWQADQLHRYLWFDQAYYLPDDILAKCDRMSMAHSLEVRPPFLDHRIVEFAASLPASLKIRGAEQKYVLRRLMEGRLPRAVLARKKEGFDIPSGDWLRGPLRELLVDTLSPDAIRRTQLFRADKVQAMISSHLERRMNWGVPLWGLLVLFQWIRQWSIECAPRASMTPESRRACTPTMN
jgi:asparagine synthase (glutamine-hydrolysing)